MYGVESSPALNPKPVDPSFPQAVSPLLVSFGARNRTRLIAAGCTHCISLQAWPAGVGVNHSDYSVKTGVHTLERPSHGLVLVHLTLAIRFLSSVCSLAVREPASTLWKKVCEQQRFRCPPAKPSVDGQCALPGIGCIWLQ